MRRSSGNPAGADSGTNTTADTGKGDGAGSAGGGSKGNGSSAGRHTPRGLAAELTGGYEGVWLLDAALCAAASAASLRIPKPNPPTQRPSARQ